MSHYKEGCYGDESQERDCGERHDSIEEAIVHAEQNLGSFRRSMVPYRGTTSQNEGVVVGWSLSPRKRWRLDYSDQPGENGEPPKWVHVNEENFDAASGFQKIVHRVSSRSFLQVSLYYRKWGSRYGLRGL